MDWEQTSVLTPDIIQPLKLLSTQHREVPYNSVLLHLWKTPDLTQIQDNPKLAHKQHKDQILPTKAKGAIADNWDKGKLG